MKIKKFEFAKDTSGQKTVSVAGGIGQSEESVLTLEHLHGYNVKMTIDPEGGFVNSFEQKNGQCHISLMTAKFQRIDKEVTEFIKDHENDCKKVSEFLVKSGLKTTESNKEQKTVVSDQETQLKLQRERERMHHIEQQLEKARIRKEQQQQAFFENNSKKSNVVRPDPVMEKIINTLLPNCTDVLPICVFNTNKSRTIASLSGVDKDNVLHTFKNVRAEIDASNVISIKFQDHTTEQRTEENKKQVISGVNLKI